MVTPIVMYSPVYYFGVYETYPAHVIGIKDDKLRIDDGEKKRWVKRSKCEHQKDSP